VIALSKTGVRRLVKSTRRQHVTRSKASGYKVALLLNFGAKRLGIKRIVYEKARM
jgi:hypothetical protein